MKIAFVKFGIVFGLWLSAFIPLVISKRYWHDYQVLGMDTIDQYSICLCIATALMVSGIWLFVVTIIKHKDD